jgi:DNA (cytosine-5)-methyltransferase 1
LNGLALCSGYGGLELALERFFPGYKTVCHVEGESFAVSHLIKKMEEGRIHPAPVWDDLRTFEGDRWRGVVDIIAGGFPCQPFSVAGKQLASEDPRHLWPSIVQIVRQVRPRFLFFENVPGVVKWILDRILLDLAALGYDASWCVVRAADVGAPHSRARWFLFAETRHPDSIRLEGVWPEERSERINKKRRKNLEGFELNNDCEDIASEGTDTVGEGIQRQRGQHEESGRKESGQRNLNSDDKWDGGFGSWWEIEPSMGRLVDGAPDWVDKLRLLGNGVVPQQAHYALTILTSTLPSWSGLHE